MNYRELCEEVVLRLLQSYTRRPAVSKTNLSLQKIKDTAVPILKKYVYSISLAVSKL